MTLDFDRAGRIGDRSKTKMSSGCVAASEADKSDANMYF